MNNFEYYKDSIVDMALSYVEKLAPSLQEDPKRFLVNNDVTNTNCISNQHNEKYKDFIEWLDKPHVDFIEGDIIQFESGEIVKYLGKRDDTSSDKPYLVSTNNLDKFDTEFCSMYTSFVTEEELSRCKLLLRLNTI